VRTTPAETVLLDGRLWVKGRKSHVE